MTSELKAMYAYKLMKNNNILYLTDSLYEANKMYQSISKYTDDVLLFPMDDFITSEALAVSPELKATRLETLIELLNSDKKIVITNLMGYLRYLPKKELFKKKQIVLKTGQDYNMHELIDQLYEIGYVSNSIVSNTGDMAIRGFVLDIFPINEVNPIRLEYWGDTIDSIRVFNTESQMTIKIQDKIVISPNTEFLTLNKVEDEFKKQKNLSEYSDVVNINDYLENNLVIYDNYNNIINGYKNLLNEILEYNTSINSNSTYMNELNNIKEEKVKYFYNYDNSDSNTKKYESYNIDNFPTTLELINKRLNEYLKNNKTIIICLNNRYQINKILDNIENIEFIVTNEDEIYENKINLIIKNINDGFIYNNYVVIGEKEMFHQKEINARYKSNFKFGSKINDITKLTIGDYIVHKTHGIGRYIGLKTLTKNKIKKDYLAIEYRDSDKLYIPVEKIDLISKYSSNDGIVPKINKLNSTDWAKTKIKIRKKLENIASELLKLYAERQASVGFSFDEDDKEQIEFENKFVYEDTIDQHKASEEIKRDMESKRPMDRLLCGDVGYGKTEVAFRAIFKAVVSGKQVAYLCPTTILSNQHYKNACERFSDYPINIALLNRFVTPKKVDEVIKGLKDGKIDIVIGTHKLFNDKIIYKDLGLLVIDEEQRFGVKHKEKIKELKNNIDVLTLSATPIPRTLQMSMTGLRSLSLIETPPTNRYPIQTYVLEQNNAIIKDAIYKELSRNGQIFILYNNVAELDQKKIELQKLIPDAKIVIAHGQMFKTELEDIMIDFTNKEYDILLCTTIIETGIDIPNVNTLIILDADRFGLSQLYQIRGRVGRSNKIAYCYLMYHPGKSLTDVATKRLNAIKEFTELGSGYSIAMRDLSIRGAGDILGSEQAGFIDSVGIELYLSMLNEEVNKLKGNIIEEEKDIEQPLIDVETSINDNYVDNTDLKIEIHKKINTIDSYEKLHQVKTELEDRFGNISEEMLIYMYEEWFEKLCKKMNINRIKQLDNSVEVILDRNLTQKVNGDLLFIMVSDITRNFRFKMKDKCLIISLDLNNLDKHFIYYLIEFLEVLEKAID